MKKIYCVIMAGGVGSRFWPMSREDKPKQFIDILGTGKTFIRQTYERFSSVVEDANFLVVTNSRYKDLVLEQLPELSPDQVLCEPMRRNTAPCVAYAAYRIAAQDKNATMIVTPADHLITDNITFNKIIASALSHVDKKEMLMTIGIEPNRPETGYGYIQVGSEIDKAKRIFKVKTFTEKPNAEMAEVFVDSGEFFWNSGMFIWSVSAIIDAIQKHTPDINALFANGVDVYGTPEEQGFIELIYPNCPNISIDYGIMEKADNVDVICADFGWSDIGSWCALFNKSTKDDDENSSNSDKITLYNTKRCVVRAPQGKLVVIDGLEDYIVVDSEDALLITPSKKEQEIKNYVEDIKLAYRDEFV